MLKRKFLRITVVIICALSILFLPSGYLPKSEAGFSSSFDTLKADYPEHLNTIIKNGASEAEVKHYLADLDAELAKKTLTKDNFDRTLINASIKVALDPEHEKVALALLAGFPGYLSSVKEGKVPVALKPIRDVLFNILLPEDPPEDEDLGGGGGGGGGYTPPDNQAATESDETVLDEESGKITLTVDSNKIEELIKEAAGEVLITAPDSAVNKKEIIFPASGIKLMGEAGKSLNLEFGNITFCFPGNSLSLSNEEQSKNIVLSVEQLEGSSGASFLISQKTVDEGLKPIGQVFEFKFELQEAAAADQNNIPASDIKTTFASPVTVRFDLPENLVNVDLEKLGIYRIEKDGTLTYVGGRLSQDGKHIETGLWSFSRYVVMEYQAHFADVSEGHWACRDIELMAARHIVMGMEDNEFEPEGLVTRAQFAALLQRSLGLKAASGDAAVDGTAIQLKDLPAEAWSRDAIQAAVKAGIIRGYEDNTFRPEQTITRQEMAVMAVRAAHYNNPAGIQAQPDTEASLVLFKDRASIDSWARAAFAEAAAAGIINGRDNGEIVPLGTATRAEATVILARLLKYASLY